MDIYANNRLDGSMSIGQFEIPGPFLKHRPRESAGAKNNGIAVPGLVGWIKRISRVHPIDSLRQKRRGEVF
jgi:hypothetical protein